MIKLTCIRDVVMSQSGDIAFKAGEEYCFHLKADGDIERFADNCLHKFMCYGPDSWTNYFVRELEDV
jgi:hypothetical protein